MDKKTIYGLLVIGVILFGFTWYNTNEATKLNREKDRRDSIVMAEHLQQRARMLEEQAAQDTVERVVVVEEQAVIKADVESKQVATSEDIRKKQLGDQLFEATAGEEKLYTMENDVMRMTVSSKGAKVVSVELKEYKKYGTDDFVQLCAPGSAEFDLSFFIIKEQRNAQINSSNFYFTSEQSELITFGENDQLQGLAMRLYVDETAYMEYVYTMRKDDYMVDFRINFVNMKDMFSNQTDMLFVWDAIGPQSERGFKNENMYSTVSYKFPSQTGIEDLGISDNSKQERVDSRVQWVAFKRQFFSSVFIAEDSFLNAEMRYDTYVPTNDQINSADDNIKKFNASMTVPFSSQTTEYNFKFYYGPNKFTTLKQYDIGLQRLVPLGWGIFGWVNKFIVIPVFDFLGNSIASYGLIIFLLTIFIKLLILPMTYKSYLSMAKMRLLKPQIDEITEKFPKKEDAMKKQQATMALYKSAGVSPMGGCLPMLIQMPVLIAMFRFFPASIELRGESFLWAKDLSSYDSILSLPFNIPFYGDHVSLFALLMALSIFVSSKLNAAQQAASAPQMAGMKFMMLYMMPVMMILWFNNYASGLCYYYFISTLITILQTYFFRYVVNDEKLFAKMKETAKKPKKQSKWQQRYAEMAKQQQAQQQKTLKGGKRKR